MISPDDILNAYQIGIFPMADARDDADVYWVQPQMRGIIPMDAFNTPRTLKKFMATCDYTITFNNDFAGVINACAQTPRGDGKGTWINHDIEDVFNTLHDQGHAHSVEVWNENGALIGGLYGLAQGGCFNGESMFSHAPNASKIALSHLHTHLETQGFMVLDTQFINDHLKQFGCIEIPQSDYVAMMHKALEIKTSFTQKP
jgi:leucyl/phenylalanyl-tRNA--protein transferase